MDCRVMKDLGEPLILDIGCGAQPHGNPNILLDIYRSPYVNIIADAQRLPFKNNIINRIFCHEVLEHLENPLKAIREMHRVLKTGSTATITFPKPFCGKVMRTHLLEYLLDLPFLLVSIPYLYAIVKACYLAKKLHPTFYHKWIMKPDSLKPFFEITKIEGYCDIALPFLTSGRKGKRLQKIKPFEFYACNQIECRQI